jgi:hypothetical protein
VENYPVNQGFHLVNSNYFLQFCWAKASEACLVDKPIIGRAPAVGLHLALPFRT